MKQKCRIKISNMHCSNCSASVEKHFNKQKDISVNVILSENEGIFTYDDQTWNEKKIEKQLKKIGYRGFHECSNLNKIDLSNVIELDDEVFKNCKNLKQILRIKI